MSRSLAQSADWHMRVYWQVKAVALTDHADAPTVGDIEDYGADAYAYDVWTEDPSGYERDEGRRPGVPLWSGRRAELKEKGFAFKANGVVLYRGEPAYEWAKSHGWVE